MSRVELVAAATITSVLVGLLLPTAVHHSLNRGILVFLCGTIGAGLILGLQSDNSVGKTLINTLWPSVFIPVTYVAFLFVRYLVSLAPRVGTPVVFLPGASSAEIPVEAFGPEFSKTVLVIFSIASVSFVAAFFLISLVTLASRPILIGITHIYSFGGEGITRVQRLVVAITGLVSAVIMLWAAFVT